ncbi:major facilitator superfamily MFS_1 [Methanobacterium lacus]|uniref:Major facilitator superfamily MFS_1 n=1 Tax=Methanobacterium lacus (strain AL-21) TaxID=877455 RepID=F0T8H4_METLA|nr:MFS transporter [Methanobacterium lacus]ADZ09725.1 major facilitator superfamily MFS_1 [Methanobacterium lacus]
MNEKEVVKKQLNVGWFPLIIVTLAAFIISIDISFLNVAITNLVNDLHTTVVTIQSIIVVYSLVLASLTLLSGELQKVLGRRKTFLLGAFIFGVGNFIAALSINSTMLLIGWSVLEGAGGALMWVSMYSIVIGSYTGNRRATALGLSGSIGSLGLVVGPFIGGFLTTYLSWRYAFGLEFIIILLILVFSRHIPSFPATMHWSDINIVGGINSALGIFLLVYGLILLNDPSTLYIGPYVILAGIILLAVFFYDQRSRIKNDKHPLVDIRIFKIRSFALGNIFLFLYGSVVSGIRFVIPVFVQSVLGYSALLTGYLFAAMALPMFFVTFTTGRISGRFHPRHIISIGFIVCLIGAGYLIYAFSSNPSFIEMIIGMAVIGLGIGIIAPHGSTYAFSEIKHDKQPDASAIRSTNSNLNSSVGTAIFGLILLMGAANALNVEQLSTGMLDSIYAMGILLFVGLIMTQFIKMNKITES